MVSASTHHHVGERGGVGAVEYNHFGESASTHHHVVERGGVGAVEYDHFGESASNSPSCW